MNEPLKRVPWKDAEVMLRKVKATDLVSSLKPIAKVLKEPTLYLARYPYGELIVDNGKMLPPLGTSDSQLRQEFEKATNYCSIPLTVVVSNSAEVFIDGPNARVVSLRVLEPGELFGVFEVLDTLTKPQVNRIIEKPPWSVSSGARSVHLLAAIENADLQKRMSACLGVDSSTLPWDLLIRDGWHLIKRLAYRAAPEWHTEVLVVPDTWLIPGREDKPYHEIQRLLFRCGWNQSESMRNAFVSEATLAASISEVMAGLHKCKLDSFDTFLTVRHLLATAQGQAVAFQPVPSVDGQVERGPFLVCQEFLVREHDCLYGAGHILTDHHPVILQPSHLMAAEQAGFFSFSTPSTLSAIPRIPIKQKGGLVSWAEFLREMASVLTKFQSDKPGLFRTVKSFGLFGEFQGTPAKGTNCYKRADLKSDYLHRSNESDLAFHSTHGFFTACVKVVRS